MVRGAVAAGMTVLLGLGAVLAVPGGQAQIHSCGEGLTLFIRNPDIVPDPDGVFHVSGSLLVQFQVIGAEADKIEAFGLSFGFDVPTGDEVCDAPPQAWLTGLYLEGYAVDQDKSDGFFIAINSNGQTSPQAELGVAVHGYDANHQEIARFWGQVDLDHCGSQPSMGCPDTDFPDFTMPWPILLPGDGAKTYVDGFTFEFNEKLSALTVELNGINVTSELQEWAERPTWDTDNVPDGGPGGAFMSVAAQCTQPEPVQSCGPMAGPAYKWTNRKLTDADIVRIIATDLKGNTAIKEIHIGSSVAGGTIADGVPILQMTFDRSNVAVPAGQNATFPMTLINSGGGTAHPFARADVPPGWTYKWVPEHKPVAPGGKEMQELQVVIPANATPGNYPVRAIIDYQQAQDPQTLESALSIDVLAGGGGDAAEAAANAAKAGKGAPALGPLAVIGLVGLALILRRR